MNVDWSMAGSLADWSTTLIALIALVVAGLAAKATIQTNRAQQETLELQRLQYERAQASKVTFYVDLPKPSAETPPEGGLIINFDDPKTAHVSNASDSPIYAPCLVQTYPGADKPIVYAADYLFPTGTEPAVWNLNTAEPVGLVRWHDLYFKDAMGIHWIRKSSGELIKATRQDEVELGQMLADDAAPDGLDF